MPDMKHTVITQLMFNIRTITACLSTFWYLKALQLQLSLKKAVSPNVAKEVTNFNFGEVGKLPRASDTWKGQRKRKGSCRVQWCAHIYTSPWIKSQQSYLWFSKVSHCVQVTQVQQDPKPECFLHMMRGAQVLCIRTQWAKQRGGREPGRNQSKIAIRTKQKVSVGITTSGAMLIYCIE